MRGQVRKVAVVDIPFDQEGRGELYLWLRDGVRIRISERVDERHQHATLLVEPLDGPQRKLIAQGAGFLLQGCFYSGQIIRICNCWAAAFRPVFF